MEHCEGAKKFYRELANPGRTGARGHGSQGGHARWFERPLAELNIELWLGNAAEAVEGARTRAIGSILAGFLGESRRGEDLLQLLDRLNPTSAELMQATEQEAEKSPQAAA